MIALEELLPLLALLAVLVLLLAATQGLKALGATENDLGVLRTVTAAFGLGLGGYVALVFARLVNRAKDSSNGTSAGSGQSHGGNGDGRTGGL